jgi:hypothetical protein
MREDVLPMTLVYVHPARPGPDRDRFNTPAMVSGSVGLVLTAAGAGVLIHDWLSPRRRLAWVPGATPRGGSAQPRSVTELRHHHHRTARAVVRTGRGVVPHDDQRAGRTAIQREPQGAVWSSALVLIAAAASSSAAVARNGTTIASAVATPAFPASQRAILLSACPTCRRCPRIPHFRLPNLHGSRQSPRAPLHIGGGATIAPPRKSQLSSRRGADWPEARGVGLIRFFGHQAKGEYDGADGEGAKAAA